MYHESTSAGVGNLGSDCSAAGAALPAAATVCRACRSSSSDGEKPPGGESGGAAGPCQAVARPLNAAPPIAAALIKNRRRDETMTFSLPVRVTEFNHRQGQPCQQRRSSRLKRLCYRSREAIDTPLTLRANLTASRRRRSVVHEPARRRRRLCRDRHPDQQDRLEARRCRPSSLALGGAGTHTYHCEDHPWAIGQITVEP